MITVRSQSTRLPQKCFLPFGDGNVLEHMIRRARAFDIAPVVCTTVESADDGIVEIAKQEGVRYFRGSEKDKLLRWRDACRKHNIERFVTVDADDLFFDGELSHKSFETLGESFDLITHPPQQPFHGFYEGCVGFSLTADIIEKACEIKNTDDTEMMWYFLDKVPGIRKSQLEASCDEEVTPIRLTLDFEEDYWLFQTVLKVLGPMASLNEIKLLFKNNPDLHKTNWFRNDEYKASHEEKRVELV